MQQFVLGLQGTDPRYVRVNAGCKHYDVHGGPENIPVSRFSFDAKVIYIWHTIVIQVNACLDACRRSSISDWHKTLSVVYKGARVLKVYLGEFLVQTP